MEEKNGELGASGVRHLEDENVRLKRSVADLTLDKNILQEVIKKRSTASQTVIPPKK
jgi:putative transposase